MHFIPYFYTSYHRDIKTGSELLKSIQFPEIKTDVCRIRDEEGVIPWTKRRING